MIGKTADVLKQVRKEMDAIALRQQKEQEEILKRRYEHSQYLGN